MSLVLLVGLLLFQSPSADAWVVFASSRSGNGDIYAVNPADGAVRKYFVHVDPEGSPRYDQVRKRVVFQRFDANDKATLMSRGKRLFASPNGEVAPTWSPNGAWIGYSKKGPKGVDLYIAKPDGTGERALMADAQTDRYPNWSPDGNTLVFARKLAEGWDLHTLSLATGDMKRITKRKLYVGHPVFSPDGKQVAFDTLGPTGADIAVVNLADGVVTMLTDRPGNDLVPSWSPDGSAIAFAGDPDNKGNWDIWLVTLADKKLKRLTTAEGFDGAPVFVPAKVLGF